MEAEQLSDLWFFHPLPLKVSGKEKKMENCSFHVERDWFASHNAVFLLEFSFTSNSCYQLAYLIVDL